MIIGLSIVFGIFVAICFYQRFLKKESKPIENKAITVLPYDEKVTVYPYVKGFEWGPSVSSLVIQVNEPVQQIDVNKGKIQTNRDNRTITKAYLSDGLGNPVKEPSQYITIELLTASSKKTGSPFVYDALKTFQNSWVKTYPIKISGVILTIYNQSYSLGFDGDCVNSFLTPQYDQFTNRSTYSGGYRNAFTKQEEKVSLELAAYEPAAIAGGERNPLIIWLHGAGEGGKDPSIVVYGNQVSALCEEPIQQYFKAGEQTGAYVLTLQCQTYWMDEGDGTNGLGSGDSRYTTILMDAIQDYVKKNPDVDKNRIYIGGCSNGGYMTLHMMLTYPGYFAAGFPICPGYSYYSFERKQNGAYAGFRIAREKDRSTPVIWFTKEKAEILKNQPLWFIQAANDRTLDPMNYALPIYQAILSEGATNCWFSYFENVIGTDFKGEEYLGHFSWIYAFHDQVKGVQEVKAVLDGTKNNHYGFQPNNESGGGNSLAKDTDTTYKSLYQWLNSQKKVQ